jgi:hypothetical protein
VEKAAITQQGMMEGLEAAAAALDLEVDSREV